MVHLDKAKDRGKKRKLSEEIEELEEDSTEEIGGERKRPKPARTPITNIRVARPLTPSRITMPADR